jgi:beta-1,3-galactosyltransferase 1
MIQFGFQDFYYNVTLKNIAHLRWAHENCLHSKYILKTDDDIIVNVEYLLKNLRNFQNGITGHLQNNASVVRDVDSLWFMPECMYPSSNYPDFAVGPSYLMTKNIV